MRKELLVGQSNCVTKVMSTANFWLLCCNLSYGPQIQDGTENAECPETSNLTHLPSDLKFRTSFSFVLIDDGVSELTTESATGSSVKQQAAQVLKNFLLFCKNIDNFAQPHLGQSEVSLGIFS